MPDALSIHFFPSLKPAKSYSIIKLTTNKNWVCLTAGISASSKPIKCDLVQSNKRNSIILCINTAPRFPIIIKQQLADQKTQTKKTHQDTSLTCSTVTYQWPGKSQPYNLHLFKNLQKHWMFSNEFSFMGKFLFLIFWHSGFLWAKLG